jgi:hypothetical protein
MHWTIILLYLVLLCWVLPVAPHEDVALALLGAWAAGEVVVRMMGDLLPVGFYFLFDAIVICFIVVDRRKLPRLILCLYPVAWTAYVIIDDPRTQWFCLWAVTLVQFILAGWQGRLKGSGDDRAGLFGNRRSMGGSLLVAHSPDLHAVEDGFRGALDYQSGPHPALDRKIR